MADVLIESRRALKHIDRRQILATVYALGTADRVFCIGNGGGHAHAMHFASDLRKIAHRQAYSFDNLAELTARVNDEGWESAWNGWLMTHDYQRDDTDLLFLFSCGGGRDGLSANLPSAKWGIVGERGRYEDRIVIPSDSTPVIEGCQSVIAHHLITELAK